MEFKATPITEQNVDDRDVTGFTAVFGNVDLGGDRIVPGAFKKTLIERNSQIRHLWNHQASEPPTATILDMQEVSRTDLPQRIKDSYKDATGGLLVKRRYLDTPRGNEILKGIQGGAINGMSFGYDTVKSDREKSADGGSFVRNLRELRLYESSDVNWPMNEATVASKSAIWWQLASAVDAGQDLSALLSAGATLSKVDLDQIANALDLLSNVLDMAQDSDEDDIDAYGMGFMSATARGNVKRAMARLERVAAGKGALPFHAAPMASKTSPWDGSQEVSEANVDDLKLMCAWVDPAQSDVKAGYKLPHHIADGDHEVVWDGVKAAMGALLGAQGGVDLPDADRQAVYQHLAKHYQQFGEAPPDFKSITFAASVQQARGLLALGLELKEGRVISQPNLDKLKRAIAELQGILDAAEPLGGASSSSALTDNEKLLRAKLEIKLKREAFENVH